MYTKGAAAKRKRIIANLLNHSNQKFVEIGKKLSKLKSNWTAQDLAETIKEMIGDQKDF